MLSARPNITSDQRQRTCAQILEQLGFGLAISTFSLLKIMRYARDQRNTTNGHRSTTCPRCF
jgi:hypothetical protein